MEKDRVIDEVDAPGWIAIEVRLQTSSTRYAADRRWLNGLLGSPKDWAVQDIHGPPGW